MIINYIKKIEIISYCIIFILDTIYSMYQTTMYFIIFIKLLLYNICFIKHTYAQLNKYFENEGTNGLSLSFGCTKKTVAIGMNNLNSYVRMF